MDRIVVDPGIVHGKPRIRGTRLTVQVILELLAAGETIDELLGDYDELTREDVQLPRAGDTSDAEITALADTEGRVVVTKDADFRHSHEVSGRPARLLHITLGNLTNQELLDHLERHHSSLVAALDQADFVELGSIGLTLHK